MWGVLFLLRIMMLQTVSKSLYIEARAIMVEPPHRSSLWRFRYPTRINVEDDLLNCGGFDVQWGLNSGRCGVCGDSASGAQLHNDNGIYASGIKVRTYPQGGAVNVTVEVLSNMLGYFEFRLCPRNDTSTKLTNECFEANVLWIEESWSTRYYVGSRGGIYDLHVKLPSSITCTDCVFQWKYSTGYRTGGINSCQCMGCGKQEQFYNCADVAIVSSSDPVPQIGFVPTRPSPTFLSSPESQSREFVERMLKQRRDFPWSPSLLLPHNMMTPTSSNKQPIAITRNSLDFLEKDTSPLSDLDDLNLNTSGTPFVQGIDLSQFPDYTSTMNSVIKAPGSLDINGTTPLLVGPAVDGSTTPPGQILVGDPRSRQPFSPSQRSSNALRNLENMLENINNALGRRETLDLASRGENIPNLPTSLSGLTMDSIAGLSNSDTRSRFLIEQDEPSVPKEPIMIIDSPLKSKNVSNNGNESRLKNMLGSSNESSNNQRELQNRTSPANQEPIFPTNAIIYQLFNDTNINRSDVNKSSTPKPEVSPLCDKFSPEFICEAIGKYTNVTSMDSWCTDNCRANHCPKDMCSCGCKRRLTRTERGPCKAVGAFAAIDGMNEWCVNMCRSKNCPSKICDRQMCSS